MHRTVRTTLLLVVASIALAGIAVLPDAVAETDGPLTVTADPPEGTVVVDDQVIAYDLTVEVDDDVTLVVRARHLDTLAVGGAAVDGAPLQPGDAAYPDVSTGPPGNSDSFLRADLSGLPRGSTLTVRATAAVRLWSVSSLTSLSVGTYDTVTTTGEVVLEHPFEVFTDDGIPRAGAVMTADPPAGTEVAPGDVVTYTIRIASGTSDHSSDRLLLELAGGEVVVGDVVTDPAFQRADVRPAGLELRWDAGLHWDTVIAATIPIRVADGVSILTFADTSSPDWYVYALGTITHAVVAVEPSPSPSTSPDPMPEPVPTPSPGPADPPVDSTERDGDVAEPDQSGNVVERRTVAVTG